MMDQNNFWLGISTALLIVAAVLWIFKQKKLRLARTWPTEAGRVESAVLSLVRTGETSSRWTAVVAYSYMVRGVTYSGRVSHSSLLKKSSEKWIGNYNCGVVVTIRYDPGKPKDSVLFESDQAWAKVA
jgi:hypothetical protein